MGRLIILIGSVFFLILIVIWTALWTGLALSVMWNWFIAPKFFLPALGIMEAYGVALVATTLRPKRFDPDAAKSFAEIVIMAPLSTGMVLATGWVVKLWV